MGEEAHFPKQNGFCNDKPVISDEETASSESDENDDDLDEMSPEEFQTLDSQLDALNSALDEIEQKNDDIHAQLLILLQSNREIRKQIQDATGGKDESTSDK